MIDAVSFCVRHTTGRTEDLNRCLDSIRRQGVQDPEIIVCAGGGDVAGARFLDARDWLANGEIGRINNHLCRQASKAHIVLIDSGVKLQANWYTCLRGADYFDLTGSALTTDGGVRVVDWAYPVRRGSRVLPQPAGYDEWAPKVFVSHWLMVLRREVWQHATFDETLRPGQAEDADFCRRVTEAGFRCGIVPSCRATVCRQAGPLDAREFLTFRAPTELLASFARAQTAGRDARDARRYAEAEAWLRQAEQVIPDEPSVWLDMARVYRFSGRHDAALEAADRAVRAQPGHPLALCERGLVHLQKRDHQRALDDFGAAIRGAPDTDRSVRTVALQGSGWAHLYAGAIDRAAECFRALLADAAPGDEAVVLNSYHGLMWCHCAQGEFESAAQCGCKAFEHVDVNDGLQKRSLRRGLRLARRGDPQVAESLLLVLPPDEYTHRRRASVLRRLASRVKAELVRLWRWCA